MKRATKFILTVLLLSAGLLGGRADEPLRFKEVYDLVLKHLAGANGAELEEAAVMGLLEQLYPRVVLVGTDQAASVEAVKAEPVAWTTVYEKAYGYVRVQRVTSELAKALSEAVTGLTSSNEIKGLVLDLRYAGGEDYAAAAAAADLFFAEERPMIDYGEGVKKSTAKENAVKVPLAVLVNGETEAAAEALAGILRQARLGLLLGGQSAGHASLFQEFKLETGQTLRVATTAITVGEGTALAGGGVTPDIEVDLSEADGRAYYRDAYALLSGEESGSRRRRLNEAELVRMAREGVDLSVEEWPEGEERPVPRLLRDPVLGRAIDLLKGISVVKRYRSN